MNHYFRFLFVIAVGVLAVVGKDCGGRQCGGGEQCCNDMKLGSVCYNSSTYSCLNATEGGGHYVLCGYINGYWYPAKACGDTCYDPLFYSCCGKTLYNKQNVQSNPCLTAPPQQEGPCSSCPKSCCNDTYLGPTCYNSSLYACANDKALCPLKNGIPELPCGKACYDTASDFSCCNNVLYGKSDSNNTCRLQLARNNTKAPNWDSLVSFQSQGVQYPPYYQESRCTWGALNKNDQSNYHELYNCTSFTGSGRFNFNESYYLAEFAVPSNAYLYGSFELDLYVNNANGKQQQMAIAVTQETLSSSFNLSSSAIDQYPCNVYHVFVHALNYVNITVEQGFVGYKTIPVTGLVIWALASSTPRNLQLSVSTLSTCTCLENSSGQCIYTIDCECNSPTHHLVVGGRSSSNPPKLILNR